MLKKNIKRIDWVWHPWGDTVGRIRSSRPSSVTQSTAGQLRLPETSVKRRHYKIAHSMPCSGLTQNGLLSVLPCKSACLSPLPVFPVRVPACQPCLCPLVFLAAHPAFLLPSGSAFGQNQIHLFLAEQHLLRSARDHLEAKMPAPRSHPRRAAQC